jgi:hypothetical protein
MHIPQRQNCMCEFVGAHASPSRKPWLPMLERQESSLRFVDVNVPAMVNGKSSQRASDWACESEFAGGVEKEEHPLPGPILLAGVPQSGPFADGKSLSRANALNGPFHAKCDLG